MVMLNKMKERLERECSEHRQAKTQLEGLTAQLQQIVSSSSFHHPKSSGQPPSSE